MTDKANAMLDVFHKAHAKASDYMGKASVWLLLSALALRDALRGEEMQNAGKPFPQPEAFTADDAKALAAHLIAEAGCDDAAEAKATAPFKGNSDRTRLIARDYRNRRNAAARDVVPALACAMLAKHWGKDAQADYAKGKVLIPAVWFLPPTIAGEDAQALLPRNPLSLMLEPTTTSDRATVSYFTVDGFAAYQRELTRWEHAGKPKEGKPQPADFAAVQEVGVNATGLRDAQKALVATVEAEAKAKEAQAKAEAARKAAEAAAAVAKAAAAANVDAATAKAAQDAAEAAKAQQQQAQQEAEAAKAKATEAQQQQRKPGGAVQQQRQQQQQQQPGGATAQQQNGNGSGNAGVVMTIATACNFLMYAAMLDNGKATFAPVVMEKWQDLAAAIWRNPNLAHAFLIEREAQQKEAEAQKHDAQKAKAS